MSEQQGDKTTTAADSADTQTPAPAKAALPDLMAAGDPSFGTPSAAAARADRAKAGPDLEAEALRAAERALAEGTKALAAARAHMGVEAPPVAAPNRRRELVLRCLLIFNVLVMIGVALLPVPTGKQPAADPAAHTGDPNVGQPRFNDPWNRALAAAESRDYATAVAVLDRYLTDQPRMSPSQQLSVLMALAHYSARNDDFKMAQEYQRRAEAIDKSHSLPEDLVAMAKAAAESGDQESLRRVWARFLLQQRQVPSWLYKHVAAAYLQLGDSYRVEANTAAEAARLQELEAAAAALRAQGQGAEERHK